MPAIRQHRYIEESLSFMLFPGVPKGRIIRLQPEEGYKRFYRYEAEERTKEGAAEHRSVLTKTIHVAVQKKEHGQYQLSIETFDRLQQDRRLSLGVKDLYDRIARITQDLELTIDEQGKILSLDNFREIQAGIAAFRDYVETRYKGEGMNGIEAYFRQVLGQEQSLIRYMSDFRQLGMLLRMPYGWIGASGMPWKTFRFSNFMDHTLAEVEELFKIAATDEAQGLLRLHAEGRLTAPFREPLFHYEMRRKQIPFSASDKPVLASYNRTVDLEADAHMLRETTLDIVFSFGQYYTKEIHYGLHAIAAEDLE